MELKTLKNMSFREDGSLTEKDIAKLYLKDEARKWIKLLDGQDCIGGKCLCDNCNTVRWIKHFFALEEE